MADPAVKALRDHAEFDVLHMDWLIDCRAAGMLVSKMPHHFISMATKVGKACAPKGL